MTINIINEPDSAKYYEFVVATPINEEEGTYLFKGMFADGFMAEKCATECNGIIFHDVRIQGYKKPEPNHYWVSITYSRQIEAESEEEAYDKFDEAIEGWDFNDFDWDYDIEEDYNY